MTLDNPAKAGSHDQVPARRIPSRVGSGFGRILWILVSSIFAAAASGPIAASSLMKAPGRTAAAAAGDLRGTWVFNPDLSDSPRQKLEAGDRAQPRPPMDTGRADRQERARTRDEMRRALDGPTRMTIEQDGNRVVVTGDDGTMQTFDADDRVHTSIGESGAQIERRTRWDDGALVSEVKLPQGSYTRTWQRKGSLLTITTRFSRNRGGTPVVSKRVYEREAR